jgi:hypothetical protein
MRKLFLNLVAFTARILPNSFKQAIYRIKPLAGIIRRGLNRAAPTGLVEVKIAAGDLAGFTIRLDMQIDKDYWLGTYEPELQAALRCRCEHRLCIAPAGQIRRKDGQSICL